MKNQKNRSMKVYSQNGRNYKATPTIILKGQWLEEMGFAIGDYISVSYENGKLVITPDTERAELEQMNYLHQVYQKRNLIALPYIFNEIKHIEDIAVRNKMRFTFEQLLWGMSKFSRYVTTHYSQVNQYLNGTLFIGSQVVEASPNYILNNKIQNLGKVFGLTQHFSSNDVIVSTTSLTTTTCPDDSVDYIFTDPPFGSNLMYSELNFVIEAWNGVLTNNHSEAIMNDTQKKKLLDYQELIRWCFIQTICRRLELMMMVFGEG